MRRWPYFVGISWATLLACGRGPMSLPTAHPTPGKATLVELAPLPEGHPAVPIGEVASGSERVGRAGRRLNVDQLRASLIAATGFTWVASRRVSDPDSPTGSTQLPDADMLEALAATLGRPDYVTSTNASIDPAVTFAKLANDASRVACRASVESDVAQPWQRRILVFAAPNDSLRSNAGAIKKNLSYLALRFWGRSVSPEDPQLIPLVTLFERASMAGASKDESGVVRVPAAAVDGWRAVCIAMANDPQFLTY
jgi:hypothetical protein